MLNLRDFVSLVDGKVIDRGSSLIFNVQILCPNGWQISIALGEGAYCEPRKSLFALSAYRKVEVGLISPQDELEDPPMGLPWACSFNGGVAGYVEVDSDKPFELREPTLVEIYDGVCKL
jgi:hypothetical protein